MQLLYLLRAFSPLMYCGSKLKIYELGLMRKFYSHIKVASKSFNRLSKTFIIKLFPVFLMKTCLSWDWIICLCLDTESPKSFYKIFIKLYWLWLCPYYSLRIKNSTHILQLRNVGYTDIEEKKDKERKAKQKRRRN